MSATLKHDLSEPLVVSLAVIMDKPTLGTLNGRWRSRWQGTRIGHVRVYTISIKLPELIAATFDLITKLANINAALFGKRIEKSARTLGRKIMFSLGLPLDAWEVPK